MKIVDEFTGRTLDGRRWSDGLHQAVEAKERVRIKEENHTWATVTLQNFFRLYEKLGGMTGTAETEAGEFASTYDLAVVPDPDQQAAGPRGRAGPHLQDRGGQVRRRGRRPRRAPGDRASRCWSARPRWPSPSCCPACSRSGASPTRSSTPSSTSGRPRSWPRPAGWAAITVATNMAGRGVDIILGGNPEMLARHEAVAAGVDLTTEEGQEELKRLTKRVRGRVRGRRREGARARRPLRARQRAPREPAHRQPAPGPLGSPGRPRREPLLPVPRGRADAAVRHRGDELGDGPGPARRRAHRGQDGDQGHRAGPEHRRGPQRRDPQGRPQVRRGHERAAQGDLRPPPADHRRRGPRGARPGSCSSRPSTALVASACPTRLPRGVGPRAARRRTSRSTTRPSSPPRTSPRAPAPTRSSESVVAEALDYYEEHSAVAAGRRGRRPGRSSGRSCCRSSTSAGGTTWRRWTTCVRASTCGPWASRTRWWPGSARATRCSAS